MKRSISHISDVKNFFIKSSVLAVILLSVVAVSNALAADPPKKDCVSNFQNFVKCRQDALKAANVASLDTASARQAKKFAENKNKYDTYAAESKKRYDFLRAQQQNANNANTANAKQVDEFIKKFRR